MIDEYGHHHPEDDGNPREVLKSLTTFIGGGGPRFWFSLSPELQQLNYAQIIIQVKDKHDTSHLIGPLQKALSERGSELRASTCGNSNLVKQSVSPLRFV